MRTALSTLLGLALTVPVFAQSKPTTPPPNEDAARQLKELTARLRELEARLKATDGKKDGEQKIEVRVVEVKDGDKKPEPKKEGFPMVLQLHKDGDKKVEGKEGVVVVRVQTDDEKKSDGKKEGTVRVIERKTEERKPEPKKDEPRRPDGPPMGGGFGGSFGGGPGGPPMGGGFGVARMGGPDGTPPGFDKLNREEQEQFRKLMGKMRGGDQPGGGVQFRMVERREGGERAEQRRPEPETRRVEGGERRPNLEERMERLERAIDEIRRSMKK
jgi:hypothetical protein